MICGTIHVAVTLTVPRQPIIGVRRVWDSSEFVFEKFISKGKVSAMEDIGCEFALFNSVIWNGVYSI
jgi:hypothetical protein